VIVSGTPKREIQEKVKALAHAATDITERGTASNPFGCATNDGINII
jgi:hypothetical protein